MLAAALKARFPAALIDEFQDTDPLQAEVCFLLASDPSEGDDCRRLTPRPGSLFLVGDPKQLPLCEACKSVYEMYRMFNDGLNNAPDE